MKVKYNIETGYVHRMPNREIEIDDEDLEDCNEAMKDEIIAERIQDDFEQWVTWCRVE